MYLIPSYEILKKKIVDKNIFLHLLNFQHFDESFYLETYPDLKNVKTSLKAHYLVSGYFENRLPFSPKLDKFFYQSNYQDLKTLDEKDLSTHFNIYGYLEGRLPNVMAFDFDFYKESYLSYIDQKIYKLNKKGLLSHYINEGYTNLFLPYDIFK